MPQVIKQVSTRSHVITAENNGVILSIGPGSTSSSVGTMVIQFNPDASSDFSGVIMGRCWGQAAKDQDVPFVPIPYRRCTVNNVASDYAIVSDPVSGATLIQIPANWEIGILVAASAGECSMCSWNLPGNSNP